MTFWPTAQGLELQQLVGVLADQVRDRTQHPDPLAGPGARPRALVEGPAGRCYRPIHVRRRRDRERGDLFPRRGVPVAPGGLVGRRHPVPVDQHAAVAEAEFVAVRLDGCDHDRLPLCCP